MVMYKHTVALDDSQKKTLVKFDVIEQDSSYVVSAFDYVADIQEHELNVVHHNDWSQIAYIYTVDERNLKRNEALLVEYVIECIQEDIDVLNTIINKVKTPFIVLDKTTGNK